MPHRIYTDCDTFWKIFHTYIFFLCIYNIITINCDSAIGSCIGQSHLVLLDIKLGCLAILLDNYLGLKTSKTTWVGPLNFRNTNHPTVQGYFFCIVCTAGLLSQFKIFKKELLQLPSPFAKNGDLFWSDFPDFTFFVYQGVRTGRTGLNN